MPTIETTITIARNPEEVFAFAIDPSNTPAWSPAVESSTSDGPIGPGTTGTETRRFMGRRMTLGWRITKFEPGRVYGFEYTSGPLPAQAVFTFEAVPEGTRVVCRTDIRPRGILKLLGPMIAREGKREDEGNLRRLKEAIEATPA
ncbi:MAG: SRPBCC family protein [Actinomycetota bacterium]